MDERDGLAEASSTTTIADAQEQHPLLDTSKPAASEETPSGESTVVLAQTPEEVEAQYVNRAGGPNPTQEGDADAEIDEDAEGYIDASEYADDDASDDGADEAPAAPAAAADPADADAAADSGPVLDIEGDDTADGGDVTGR